VNRLSGHPSDDWTAAQPPPYLPQAAQASWTPAGLPPAWLPPPPAPRRPRRRWLLILAIAVPALVVLALVGAEVLGAVAGCGSVDPGDPANYSSIRILNDSAGPVIVDQCAGSYCRPGDPPRRLAQGQALAVDAACGVSGSEMTSWRVSRADNGSGVGYIAVHTPRKRDGLRYRVSHASASRQQPTPTG
jgi:hypothetical protein